MVRTPDPENDLGYLKRRETTLMNELSRVRKKIKNIITGKVSKPLVEEVKTDSTEGGADEKSTKKKSKSKKKE